MTREQTIEKLKALYTNAVATMLRADACGDDESSKVMTEYAETLDSAITALQTALQTDGDCISRREAIRIASGYCHPANVAKELAKLPSAQQEEAIPVAWLEEQVKWFESMDNAFAKIEANNIRVMIKKWRSEKDERPD